MPEPIEIYIGICVTTDGGTYIAQGNDAEEAGSEAYSRSVGAIAYIVVQKMTLPPPVCPQIETVVTRTDTINRVVATHKPA